MWKEESLTNNYLSGFYWLTKSNRKIVIAPDQLMVRFGASWFGILGATLKITIPLKGHPNFPNHHTPKQLTISRAVDLATNPGNQYLDPAWMVPAVADLRLHPPHHPQPINRAFAMVFETKLLRLIQVLWAAQTGNFRDVVFQNVYKIVEKKDENCHKLLGKKCKLHPIH